MIFYQLCFSSSNINDELCTGSRLRHPQTAARIQRRNDHKVIIIKLSILVIIIKIFILVIINLLTGRGIQQILSRMTLFWTQGGRLTTLTRDMITTSQEGSPRFILNFSG